MNIKRFLLASLAGFVALNVAYVLLELVIFKNYMDENVIKPTGATVDETALWPLIPVVLMILIMAYMYPKGYEGGAPAAEALRFGILMGLFAGVPYGVFFGGMFSLGFGPIAVLSLLYTVEVAVTGLAMGLVYGRSGKTAPAT